MPYKKVVAIGADTLVIDDSDSEAAVAALEAHVIVPAAPMSGGGTLGTNPILLAITQATAGTDGFLRAVDFATFAAKMTNVMSQIGDIIYGGLAGIPTRLGIGAAGRYLRSDGTTPQWSTITESDLTLANNATNNTTAARHGFAPMLSGLANQYLAGDGSWSTPAGVVNSYTSVGYNLPGGGNVNVVHNWGAYPVVQCVDNAGVVVAPTSITHNTLNDFTVNFAGAAQGTVIASIGSPQAQAYRATGASGNIALTDHIVKATTAGITLTLPTAVGQTGREFCIDNAAAESITLACQAGEKIEGEDTQPVPSDSAILVYSDGAGWRIR